MLQRAKHLYLRYDSPPNWATITIAKMATLLQFLDERA